MNLPRGIVGFLQAICQDGRRSAQPVCVASLFPLIAGSVSVGHPPSELSTSSFCTTLTLGSSGVITWAHRPYFPSRFSP